MGFLALAADERVVDVKFTKDALSVALRDGRTITVPLAWYPRLFNATTLNGKTGALPAAATASIGRNSTRISARRGCCGELLLRVQQQAMFQARRLAEPTDQSDREPPFRALL